MSVTWFVPRSDLSPDQLRAVELPAREHAVVIGAPGSGKTLVLLHRAARFIEEGGVPPKRLRIFVFTNTLKDYIVSTLRQMGIPETCVTTFDYWCKEFYTAFVGRRLPFDRQGPDFDAIRAAVLDKLRGGGPWIIPRASKTPPVQCPLWPPHEPIPRPDQAEFPEFFTQSVGGPLYDVALVDEGQDLTPQAFEILKRIACHVSVYMDSRQQLYEHRSGEEDILRALGLRKRNLAILGAYRCCPYIADLAASLLDDPSEQQAFLCQTRTVQREKLTPLLYIAANADEEKNRLARIIKDRQLAGDRIAVLLPNNAKLFSLARLLTELGLEVEVPSATRAANFPAHDFNSERPKLFTYYGAKGLTFETVLLPRLVPSSFPQIAPGRLDKLLFVGITRATRWVYMSTVEGTMLPVVNKIAALESRGVVSIQRSQDTLALFDLKNSPPALGQAPTHDPLTDLL